MQFPAIRKLFLLTCLLRASLSLAVPKQVILTSGEGFLIRVDTAAGEGPLQNCQLTRNNKTYSFIPGDSSSHVLENGEVAHPFDSNNQHQCGVRVYNATSFSSGEWKLSTSNSSGFEISGVTTVTVQNEPATCPEEFSSQEKCKMIDINTLNESPCGSETHWKSYLCNFWSEGKMSMTSLEFDNHLAMETPIQTPTTTEAGSTIFECWLGEQNMEIIDCFIEHVPTGRRFYISDGLQGVRYSAYMTDFQTGVCQFEIPPGTIQDDEEGLWKMIIEGTNPHGANFDSSYYPENTYKKAQQCKFQLKSNSTRAKDELEARTRTTIRIQTVNNLETIQCASNLFYPLHLCYLVDNEKFRFSDGQGFEDGNCEFQVGPANWTCGFNGPSVEDEDFTQKFEVIKYETEAIDEKFTADEDGTVTLECHLIKKMPIKLCMFLSPSGQVYRLPTDKFKATGGTYSYYSAGGKMMNGDCGIEFAAGVDVESGRWKCVIGKLNGEKVDTEIMVEEKEAILSDHDNAI